LGGWRTTARRLAGSGVIALALMAGGVVLAPDPGQTAAGVAGAPGSVTRAPVPLPDAPPASAGAGGPVLGVVGAKPSALVRLDPRTLRALPGRRIRFPYSVSSYGWSPDRSLLVLGDFDDDVLHMVDPVAMRLLGRVRFGIAARAPQSFAWLGPRRLAVVAGMPSDGSHLVMVDPVARRVLSSRRLEPAEITAADAGDRMVLLSAPIDRIGPVRLLVVDARGRVQTVGLPGIQAGFQPPPDWDRPGAYGVGHTAALAVDPEGGRAFVVAAGRQVAEVDLASLQVAYHGLRQPAPLLQRLAHWLVPRAEAKLGAGTWRQACWLGGDSLAVWGMTTWVSGARPAEQHQEQQPSGVKLLDTRSWTVRPVDQAATAASWQAGRLLTFGGTWDAEAERHRGVGLTVYRTGQRPPVHLLGSQVVSDVHLNGDLVYVAVDHGGEQPGHAVVSLESGRVLAASPTPMPYPLIGDRDRPC
jgi:hypothetical protein